MCDTTHSVAAGCDFAAISVEAANVYVCTSFTFRCIEHDQLIKPNASTSVGQHTDPGAAHAKRVVACVDYDEVISASSLGCKTNPLGGPFDSFATQLGRRVLL